MLDLMGGWGYAEEGLLNGLVLYACPSYGHFTVTSAAVVP
jgi:hypothetical protein